MSNVAKRRGFLSQFRSGTRSLKATLGLYFLPLAVLPAIFLSLYATRVFEESTREAVQRRAETERDAFVAEVQRFEKDLLDLVRGQRENRRFLGAVTSGLSDRITQALSSVPENISLRVYSNTGRFLGGRLAPWDHQVSFIAENELAKVKSKGETRDRFFATKRDWPRLSEES